MIEAITAQRGLGRWTRRLVPRPGARPARRLARRRPRRAQGGVVLLRFGQRSRRDGGTRGGRTIRALAQHRLPHAARRGEVARMTRAQRHPRRPARARGALAGVRGRGAAAGARGGRRRRPSSPRSAAIVESGLGWVAEKDGAAVGMVLARRRGPRVGRITDLYVRPADAGAQASPRRWRARSAVRFAADGVDTIDLEVMASNTAARAAYARWGFRDEVLVLATPVAALADRLGEESVARLVRLDPRPDGRRRRDPEGGRDVRAPAARTIARARS